MLVEDEPVTRSSIQQFLERDGHRVVAVDAAEEGIVEAGETPPDVLIADVQLPGLSGIEFASFMLAQDPGLAVILMSRDPDPELARMAMACGAVQHILRPFDWFELQAAVRVALRHRDAASHPLPGIPFLPHEAPGIEAAPAGSGAAVTGIDNGSASAPFTSWDAAFGIGAAATPALESGHDGTAEVAGPDDVRLHDENAGGGAGAVGFEPGESGAGFSGPGGADATVSIVEEAPASSGESVFPGSTGAATSPSDGNTAAAIAVAAADAAGAGEWAEQADRASFAGPGHGDRVARIALVLLGEMPEPVAVQPSDLVLAARVHEVGRLQRPDGDPVTVAARGAEILATTGFPGTVTEAIRHMHERWDGTSGPDGLSGPGIPAGARILAVADALDHYASAWVRGGVEPELAAAKAIQLVTVQQNLAFGPGVVGAMHRASDRLPRICAQDRLREQARSVPVPALDAAESVPFALFASE